MNDTDWFSDVKPNVHSRNKSFLAIIDYFSYVRLGLGIQDFVLPFMRDIISNFLSGMSLYYKVFSSKI